MKKFFMVLLIVFVSFLSVPAYSAVTTIDGVITLDFYEDTQLGIPNMWVLDFTLNDIDGLGGVEGVSFETNFYNTWMNFSNQYNPNPTDDYYIWTEVSNYNPEGVVNTSHIDSMRIVPVGTNIILYAIPFFDLPPATEFVYGTFYMDIHYTSNLDVSKYEAIALYGPVGFAPVPEPMSMALFVFGAFLLKLIAKRK